MYIALCLMTIFDNVVMTVVDLEMFLKFNKMRLLVSDLETLARSLGKSELLQVWFSLCCSVLTLLYCIGLCSTVVDLCVVFQLLCYFLEYSLLI